MAESASVASRREGNALVLALAGRLDAGSTGAIWRQAMSAVGAGGAASLVVDASGLDYCDGAGASLLVALRRHQESAGAPFALEGLRDEFQALLRLSAPSGEVEAEQAPRQDFFVDLGKASVQVLRDTRLLTVFVGQLTLALLSALRHPRSIRGRDFFKVAEAAGIGAIPIIMIVGFLLGLILLFQSAIPMKRFGAEIYAADLLGIATLRELGPLMAAILLTARSGSAFSAELGTMKVNEEIDALTTMGLEPVRFLVVPRVLAAVTVVPILTMLMNLSALVGGAVVFLSLGFPLVTYAQRVVSAASTFDLMGGLLKSLVLGVIVAAVGCLRGIQAGQGAGAVGSATTSAVVTGIILIAIAEGIFAVLFYVLGL